MHFSHKPGITPGNSLLMRQVLLRGSYRVRVLLPASYMHKAPPGFEPVKPVVSGLPSMPLLSVPFERQDVALRPLRGSEGVPVFSRYEYGCCKRLSAVREVRPISFRIGFPPVCNVIVSPKDRSITEKKLRTAYCPQLFC